MGIIIDKLFATYAFMDLQEVWNYNPNIYDYAAMYDYPFGTSTAALTQRVLDDMLGANYDTFAWFKYTALELFASATNSNLVSSIELKERIAIKRFDTLAAFEAEFGTDVLPQVQRQDNSSQVFVFNARLGFDYQHALSLDFLPVDSAYLKGRSFSFLHRFEAIFPNSRASRRQELYMSARLMNSTRLQIYDGLDFGWDAFVQYNANAKAERAGVAGGMNDQLEVYGALALEYELALPDPIPGTLGFGFDAWTWLHKYYPSADRHVTDSSSVSWVNQEYGWDLSVSYTPVEYFTFQVAIEQGGNALRNGILNPKPFHRDEVELVFYVTGRY